MLLKALRPLAVLAGALIVVWLVWEIGVATLVAELRKLSWRLPLILLPQAVTNLFKTEAWRLAFPRRRPRFGLLFPVRLAGEAVNETTPTATMGGDALKAFLLVRASGAVPIEEGFVSVVVAKTALVASLAAFIGGAFVLAWATEACPRRSSPCSPCCPPTWPRRPRVSCGCKAGACSGWAAVRSRGSGWAIAWRWAQIGSTPTCGGSTGSAAGRPPPSSG